MITNDILSEAFIRKIVARDSGIIYDTQAAVIDQYLQKRSGRLTAQISRRYINVLGTKFTFKVLNYLRLLEIKYRKQMTSERANLSVYNRVIWGVLYHETLPDLRYGFTQDIKDTITAELKAGLQEKSSK